MERTNSPSFSWRSTNNGSFSKDMYGRIFHSFRSDTICSVSDTICSVSDTICSGLIQFVQCLIQFVQCMIQFVQCLIQFVQCLIQFVQVWYNLLSVWYNLFSVWYNLFSAVSFETTCRPPRTTWRTATDHQWSVDHSLVNTELEGSGVLDYRPPS
jgi:hypothetical protein